MKKRFLRILPASYLFWMSSLMFLLNIFSMIWNSFFAYNFNFFMDESNSAIGINIVYIAVIIIAYLCLRGSRFGYITTFIIYTIMLIISVIFVFNSHIHKNLIIIMFLLPSTFSLLILFLPSTKKFFLTAKTGLLKFPKQKMDIFIHGLLILIIIGVGTLTIKKVGNDKPLKPIRIWERSLSSGEGVIVAPINIAVDNFGLFVMPRPELGDIVYFSESGEIVRTIKGLNEPIGVTCIETDMTIIAECSPPKLLWIDKYGNTIRTILLQKHNISYPGIIGHDSNGTIYVFDRSTRQIIALSKDGNSSYPLPVGLKDISTFAVGVKGDLWLVDSNNTIVRYDIKNHAQRKITIGDSSKIYALTVSNDGRVFVTGKSENNASTLWCIYYRDNLKIFKSYLTKLLPDVIAFNGSILLAYDQIQLIFAEFQL